ncbi:MAG: hypothetical protein ACRCS8_01005 [Brevinema sp.]
MKKMTFAFLVTLFAIGTSFAQNSEVKFDAASGASYGVSRSHGIYFKKSGELKAIYTDEKGKSVELKFMLEKVISSKIALYKKGNQFIGVLLVDKNIAKITPPMGSEKEALDTNNMTLIFDKKAKK